MKKIAPSILLALGLLPPLRSSSPSNPGPSPAQEQQAADTLAALTAELLQLRAENRGATAAQMRDAFERWWRQHSAALDAVRPILAAMAEAAESKAALAPMARLSIPWGATDERKEFIEQENMLTQALATLKRSGLEFSLEEQRHAFQQWNEKHAEWLATHRALAEKLNADAEREDERGDLTIAISAGATQQEREFWLEEAALNEDFLDLRARSVGGTAEERRDALQKWLLENAARLKAHEHLRQQLEHR